MNEDLHHIDDLFRKGIEGHEEAVPPAAWEAVSNDLDKKQASYYKNKYDRLKRAGLLLFFLCFLTGGYLLYEGLKKSATPAPGKSETGPLTAPAATPEEQAEPGNVVINRNNKSTQEHSSAGIQKDSTSNKIRVDSTNGSPLQKQSEAQTNTAETKQRNEHSSIVLTSPLNASRTKPYLITATDLLKKQNKQENKLYTNSNLAPETDVTFLPYLQTSPLAVREYSAPFIQLHQLHQLNITKKFRLPADATPASVKSNGNNATNFSLTAFAAPNIAFNRLKDDDRLSGPGRNRHDAHREEQENISFSGGLLLNYGLLKNLRLQSGVTVTTSSTAIDAKTVYAKRDNSGHTHYELHCSSGYVYLSPKDGVQPAVNDSARTSGTTSSITYISIPVSVGYRLGSGKVSLYPSIGVGLNLLAGSKASTTLQKGTTNESATSSISGLKPTYMDAHIGLGVEYNLTKKLSVGLRPNARLALTPMNRETPVKSYQNFLSVETGVRIKF